MHHNLWPQDRYDDHYAKFSKPLKECEARCRDDPKCKSSWFRHSGNMCRLYDFEVSFKEHSSSFQSDSHAMKCKTNFREFIQVTGEGTCESLGGHKTIMDPTLCEDAARILEKSDISVQVHTFHGKKDNRPAGCTYHQNFNLLGLWTESTGMCTTEATAGGCLCEKAKACTETTCELFAKSQDLPFFSVHKSNGAPKGCVQYKGRVSWNRNCINHPNCGTDRCNGCKIIPYCSAAEEDSVSETKLRNMLLKKQNAALQKLLQEMN